MKRALAFLVLVLAPTAAAQFESPLLSRIQLNPSNPGGKSIAMGGAFVSTADDATAGIANPAGLPQISSWQVGASGKRFLYEPVLRTANYFATGSTTAELLSVDDYQPTGDATDLEFASIVAPIASNVSIALYQAVTLRYQMDATDLTGGSYRAFLVLPGSGAVRGSRSLDEGGGLDIRNRLYGVSAGARFGPLSLGAGVTFNKLDYEFTGGANGGPHLFVANGDNIGSLAFDIPRVEAEVTSRVTSGARLGWLVGFRYDLIETSRLAIGGVYRRFPSFDVDYGVRGYVPSTGQRFAFSCGVDDPTIPSSGASACGLFSLPDDFSVGISGLLLKNLYVALEVQHIRYSQLQDGFTPLFTNNRGQPNQSVAGGESDNVTIPRAGLEYTLRIGGSEVNLRGGYYHEPPHGMRMQFYRDANGDRRSDGGEPIELPFLSEAYRTAYDGGESEDHFSGGLGLTLGRRLSLDVAADFGRTNSYIVASAFYRF